MNPRLSEAFFSACLQIDRAAKHITELEKEIDSIRKFEAGPVENDSDDSVEDKLISDLEASEIQIIIGEIVNNLRTALNYIVIGLVCNDSQIDEISEELKQQFPMDQKPEKFAGRKNDKNYLKGVSQKHIELIREVQPFLECRWTELLSKLSNVSKHRELISVQRLEIQTIENLKARILVDGVIESESNDLCKISEQDLMLDGKEIISTLDEIRLEVIKFLKNLYRFIVDEESASFVARS